MKSKPVQFLVIGVFALALTSRAQDYVKSKEEAQKLVQGLKYQQGEIILKDGLARLDVPTNFNYLDHAGAEAVLVKLWRNPPSDDTLGMLIPADKTPLDPDCWAVTVEYSSDGYVKDDDANKINYDKLLKQMQSGVVEANKERAKQGYPTVDLIGWAAPPHYDAATHKLYWAKQLRFQGETGDTLNYSIRILGRHGVLVLNAIAGMDQLPDIEKETPQILGMVDFKEGNRYADFDPKADKVAAYGFAALVVGGLGVAAKLGFFKVIWVAILALKKFIIIGFAAAAAGLKKMFAKRKGTGTPV